MYAIVEVILIKIEFAPKCTQVKSSFINVICN